MHYVLVLGLVAGCVISDDDVTSACGDGLVDPGEACDDGNAVAGDGCTACRVDVQERMLGVRWSFRVLATGSETPCPAGAENAVVSTTRVDAAGAVLGSERADPFACSLGAAGIPVEVDALGGLVQASVRFAGPSGGWGASLPEIVDLGAMDREVAFVVLTDAGYLGLAWELIGAACAGEDASVDDIEVTSAGAQRTYVDHFACEAGRGGVVTPGVLAGTYVVTVRAKSGDAEVAAATVTGVVVGDHNRVTPLGVIDLVAP